MRKDIFARYSSTLAAVLLSGCFADLSHLEQGEELDSSGGPDGSSVGGAANGGAMSNLAPAAGSTASRSVGMAGAAAGTPGVAHAGAGSAAGTGGLGAGSAAGTGGLGTGSAAGAGSAGSASRCVGSCPTLTTVYSKDLGPVGDSTGGSVFSDDCAAGEVLTGVALAMGAWLSQIGGICQPVSVVSNSAEASGYRIELGKARPLAPHPTSATSAAVALACPPEEVVVGLRLSQQYSPKPNSIAVVPRVWISCAKLVLSKSGTQLTVDWAGHEEIGPQSGSFADGTAWFVTGVATHPLVASGVIGAAGAWVDRAGFRASAVTVAVH